MRVFSFADRLVANAVVAYVLVLALQLRVLWGVWHRDLTYGDTSSYFLTAISWTHGLQDNIVWSPLYTTFFGTVLALVHNVGTAVLLHRVIIVVAAALLVLSLMRFLVGPAMGLLLTVWWVVLPSNFNVEYEVHLFGLIPILIAAVVVAHFSGRAGRGIAFAILVGTTLLLRNELVVATFVVAIAVAIEEIRTWRRGEKRAASLLRSYFVPLAVVLALTGGAYARSYVKGHDVKASFSAKHDLNLCQVYAFTYQQRHPNAFRQSPWTECSSLMVRRFGRPMPSYLQATSANPGAIASFVGWNARLLPSGLQVSLFDATQTGDTPGFFAVKNHRFYTFFLSLAALGLVAAGAVLLWRDTEFRENRWIARRAWPIIVLGAVSLTTVVVALTERPRPEYMYGLTISLLALVGLCGLIVLRRIGLRPYLGTVALGLTLVLLVPYPTYYKSGPQPVRDAVERLQVVKKYLQVPGSVLVTGSFNYEICSYLADTYVDHCNSPNWSTLQAQVRPGRSLNEVLDKAKATVVYADSSLLSDPGVARFVVGHPNGWRRVAGGITTQDPWVILLRQ